MDTVGNDTYTGHQWCQGAAHAGVGMLIDESGNDKYFCQLESQGLGSTLGVGVLIDKAGNDRYHAYDNENGRRITFPSSQTKSHETSLSQGCGYGRRADDSDGRSLAGGVGALFDGAGDDSYYGGVFSQATGFWWSIGMLVDMGGNDKYRGVYFAQGAAAHFAIGSMIDHAGDDHYNDAQVLGPGIGCRARRLDRHVCGRGGSGHLLHSEEVGRWRRHELDRPVLRSAGRRRVPSADATRTWVPRPSSNPRGDYFRTAMPTIGVFVDLGGTDRYPSDGSLRNNAQWHHEASAAEWGFGYDTERRSEGTTAGEGSGDRRGTRTKARSSAVLTYFGSTPVSTSR